MLDSTKKFLYRQANKVSNFGRGILKILARLLGITFDENGEMNLQQVITAGTIFLFLTPLGLVFLGDMFSLVGLATIILIGLTIVNLDNTLLLIANMAESK